MGLLGVARQGGSGRGGFAGAPAHPQVRQAAAVQVLLQGAVVDQQAVAGVAVPAGQHGLAAGAEQPGRVFGARHDRRFLQRQPRRQGGGQPRDHLRPGLPKVRHDDLHRVAHQEDPGRLGERAAQEVDLPAVPAVELDQAALLGGAPGLRQRPDHRAQRGQPFVRVRWPGPGLQGGVQRSGLRQHAVPRRGGQHLAEQRRPAAGEVEDQAAQGQPRLLPQGIGKHGQPHPLPQQRHGRAAQGKVQGVAEERGREGLGAGAAQLDGQALPVRFGQQWRPAGQPDGLRCAGGQGCDCRRLRLTDELACQPAALGGLQAGQHIRHREGQALRRAGLLHGHGQQLRVFDVGPARGPFGLRHHRGQELLAALLRAGAAWRQDRRQLRLAVGQARQQGPEGRIHGAVQHQVDAVLGAGVLHPVRQPQVQVPALARGHRHAGAVDVELHALAGGDGDVQPGRAGVQPDAVVGMFADVRARRQAQQAGRLDLQGQAVQQRRKARAGRQQRRGPPAAGALMAAVQLAGIALARQQRQAAPAAVVVAGVEVQLPGAGRQGRDVGQQRLHVEVPGQPPVPDRTHRTGRTRRTHRAHRNHRCSCG